MLTLKGLVGVLAIAVLEGAIVAAPHPGALARLERFRSPLWVALLPGAIVIGTFSVLALPRIAAAFVVLAFVFTPALAALAASAVVRGRRGPLLLGVACLGVTAMLASGWLAQVSRTLVTALGCVAAGALLVQLVPRSWLPLGVVSMCAVDIVLLGAGVGQPAGALMATAASHVHAPLLDQASIGPITTDYPDLILSAVLGSTLAGHPMQRRTGVLVAVLVAGYGMILPIAGTLPATVPIALAFALTRWRPRRPRWRPRRPRWPRLAPRAQEAPA